MFVRIIANLLQKKTICHEDIQKKEHEQDGAELGQVQLQLGLDFISIEDT